MKCLKNYTTHQEITIPNAHIGSGDAVWYNIVTDTIQRKWHRAYCSGICSVRWFQSVEIIGMAANRRWCVNVCVNGWMRGKNCKALWIKALYKCSPFTIYHRRFVGGLVFSASLNKLAVFRSQFIFKMSPLIFYFFWNTVLISGDFKKVNGIFEWGNFFMTQGAWLWRQDFGTLLLLHHFHRSF